MAQPMVYTSSPLGVNLILLVVVVVLRSRHFRAERAESRRSLFFSALPYANCPPSHEDTGGWIGRAPNRPA
jgi:hypothetical protein